jgi:NAD(P)H dehydrogenase (quinone)
MDDRIAERESALIAAAEQAGVAQVVKLHGAVRHRGDPLDQEHQAAIAALKSSGLSWTIFSPQTVMETNLLSQAEAIKQTGAIWGCAGDGRVGMVAADDCGRAGAVVMTTDGHEGREYAITGPAALTFSEAAEVLTRALGRPVAYKDLSEEDFKAVLVQQAGMTAEQAEIGVLMHYRAFKRGDGDRLTDDYQRLTGQPPTTLEAWASAHAQAFS